MRILAMTAGAAALLGSAAVAPEVAAETPSGLTKIGASYTAANCARDGGAVVKLDGKDTCKSSKAGVIAIIGGVIVARKSATAAPTIAGPAVASTPPLLRDTSGAVIVAAP